MRFIGVVFAFTISTTFALASNAIFTPIAQVLQTRELNLQGYYATGDRLVEVGQLGLGLGKGFEARFTDSQFQQGSGRQSVDIQYLYLSPFGDESPGITFGVNDLFNVTPDRIRGYVGVSYQVGLNADLNESLSAIVTVGVFIGHRTAPFTSVIIPFGTSFDARLEDDGDRINAGFNLKLGYGFELRAITRGQRTMLGLNFNKNF